MFAVDEFDVPVFVRHRKPPMTPAPRPAPARVRSSILTPWPAGSSGIPAEGDYFAATTWRDVLDAATTVGRDITPWLISVPTLARREIAARRFPLSSYLARRPAAGTGRPEVVPSIIYDRATESSARSAFGYHAGMTMAEWACRGLMGLGPTTHAESGVPVGAEAGWSAAASLPDLFGQHPSAGLWLVEAKGGKRLNITARRKGAKQLDVGHLLTMPHRKVLCGTSLEDRLFMMIDIEDLLPSDVEPAEDSEETTLEQDDNALLAEARSRLLTYLALSSLPPERLSVVAVPRPVPEGDNRRPGTVRLLEQDDRTAEVREVRTDVRQDRLRTELAERGAMDMLIGRIPGTDLTLGLSRRLFAACRALAAAERSVAARVNAAERAYVRLPEDVRRWSSEVPRDAEEEVQYVRAMHLRRQRDSMHRDLNAPVRAAFEVGDAASWEAILHHSPTLTDPSSALLEAATGDSYLAIDRESLDDIDESDDQS